MSGWVIQVIVRVRTPSKIKQSKEKDGKDFAGNDIGFLTKDLVVRRASDTLCGIATLFVANSTGTAGGLGYRRFAVDTISRVAIRQGAKPCQPLSRFFIYKKGPPYLR